MYSPALLPYHLQKCAILFRNDSGPMKKMDKFSSWNADAVLARYMVDGDKDYLLDMKKDLETEYQRWERTNRLKNGLYWQGDVQDGMEESISGGRRKKYARPTINSYMYGNAKALSCIGILSGDEGMAMKYGMRADTLKNLVENELWNTRHQFFETMRTDSSANVREAIGYIPWYFNLPDTTQKYEIAWLVFPLLGALLGIPQGSSLFDLWGTGGAPMSIFYGILWGVGGLTFGLSMRYLGVALGQSIALGTCAGFGTLFPAIFAGTNLFEGNGLILLLGVCITLSGIAIIGYAGSLRAKNMSEEEKRAAVKDFALTKGLLVALLAGVMSACFALGLDAGTPIKEAALAGGVEGLYAGLPVRKLLPISKPKNCIYHSTPAKAQNIKLFPHTLLLA